MTLSIQYRGGDTFSIQTGKGPLGKPVDPLQF